MKTIDEAFIKVYAKRPSANTQVPNDQTPGTQVASQQPGHMLPTSSGSVELRIDRPHRTHASAAPAGPRFDNKGGKSAAEGTPQTIGTQHPATASVHVAQTSAPAPHFNPIHVEVVDFGRLDQNTYGHLLNDTSNLVEPQVKHSPTSKGPKKDPLPESATTSLPDETLAKAQARIDRDQEIKMLLAAVDRLTRQAASPVEEQIAAEEEHESAEGTVGVAPRSLQNTAVQNPTTQSTANQIDATESLESTPTGKTRLPFQPVWEVDAFGLPECVQRLDTEARLVMKEAGVALRRASADGLRVLAITSPGRGHGRTTVAIQLARAAAQYGLSVALVDADTDRPALADRLCVEVSRGWIDAAGDGLPLEEVAIYSISDGITLLPLIPWNEGSSKLREKGTVIQSVFEHLSRDHDLVVVDCGHIGSLGMLFNDPTHQPVDAALLVCDQRMNNAEARDAGIARLQRLGIQQVGIIENFVARQN